MYFVWIISFYRFQSDELFHKAHVQVLQVLFFESLHSNTISKITSNSFTIHIKLNESPDKKSNGVNSGESWLEIFHGVE